MARIIKEGKHVYWLDGEGIKVPVEYISEEDQRRDKFVDDLIDDAERLQGLISSYKAQMQKKVEAYLNEVAGNYGEAWQGNARIRNFSQDAEVEIRQAKLLTFDETLAVAKTKIDHCISKWSHGSRDEIIALVNQAFKVNQKQQLDVKEIMKLIKLDIQDEQWLEAMEIIKKSITVESTKQYLNFRRRDISGRMVTITLNYSAL